MNLQVGPGDDDGELIDIKVIFQFLQRWWFPIFIMIGVSLALATLILLRMDPTFRAVAILEVKQQERQIIEISGIESIEADDEFLATQIELLKSRALIEDVIESSQLLIDSKFANLSDSGFQELSRDQKIRTVASKFSENLSVNLVGRSRLIKVGFVHKDPDRAALITNLLTERFISKDLERKFEGSITAREFLEDRISIVESSLEKSERELARYASDNNIIIIEGNNSQGQEGTGSLDKVALVGLDSQLTQAKTDRLEDEARYNSALKNPINSEILTNSAITDLKSELATLQSEYSEKLETLYPDFPDMIELNSKGKSLQNKIDIEVQQLVDANLAELKSNFELSKARQSNLVGRVSVLKSAVADARVKRVEYNILQRQLETERTQYDALLQRLKEISVSDEIGESLVQIVDKAEPPEEPFAPNKPLFLGLALFLSGLVSIGCAAVVESIDNRIKTPDDVKMKLRGILLGVIPVSDNEENMTKCLSDPQSALSEAYASLRTNLMLSGMDGGPRVIQLTSTVSGEGKSVSSFGLAIRYAGLGGPVLLIDADMRLPTFLKGPGSSQGLSGLLTSNSEIKEHVQSTRYENLDLLSSGTAVPNPTELLSGQRFREIIEFARDSYHYIIVDSPPVLGLADASAIGSVVDATVLIIEAKKIRTPAVKSTLDRLSLSEAKVSGVVLTKYKIPKSGYMNYYSYSYGGNTTKKRRKGNNKKSKLATLKRKIGLVDGSTTLDTG